MKQITRDQSAYYLIGYNSSQAPSDGKFHEIKVRVKRPGVQVRARKGYWALNQEQTARAIAGPKTVVPKPVESAIAAATARPSRAAIVRTWIGTSRGESGKTRVTFVWEPLPKSPGDRNDREEPARVSLMALGTDGSLVFRGRVPDVAYASTDASGSGGRRLRRARTVESGVRRAARQSAAARVGRRHRLADARHRDARAHDPRYDVAAAGARHADDPARAHAPRAE